MEAIQSQITQCPADIIVTNKDGNIVLLVEAKVKKLSPQSVIAQLKSYLSNMETKIRFAMLANLEEICIFQINDEQNLDQKICLKTADILSHYDAEFTQKRVFILYFITLLEAWVRDLAYHWKSKKPPASEELKGIGLLDEIEGGDTYSHKN